MIDEELTRLRREREAAQAALNRVKLASITTELRTLRPPQITKLSGERLTLIAAAEARLERANRAITEYYARRA